MQWFIVLLLSILLHWSTATALHRVNNEDFLENLYIRPLPDGKVLSHFEFNVIASHAGWEGIKVDDGIACRQAHSYTTICF